jgi:hypothetical protein
MNETSKKFWQQRACPHKLARNTICGVILRVKRSGQYTNVSSGNSKRLDLALPSMTQPEMRLAPRLGIAVPGEMRAMLLSLLPIPNDSEDMTFAELQELAVQQHISVSTALTFRRPIVAWSYTLHF